MLLGLYLLYALAASLMVPAAIYPFFPDPGRIDGFESVRVEREDGSALELLVTEGPEGAPAVLYFMGNAGSLAAFAPILARHRAAGRSVVAMTYRGGGGTEGRPSEAGLKADALTAHDAVAAILPGHGPLVVEGYSLGTGLALHVAARREVDGVILAAPYGRLCRLMTRRSGVPACLVPWIDRWRSDRDASELTVPVLMLHGDEDVLIPPGEGLRLAATLPEGVGRFERLAGVGHNDLTAARDYWPTVEGFIAGLAP
ncbi:alpha/beta hydrolase [Histidinibacterium lentulum]|nr:alpha/beta hydrolase [Histidinibacterium lentulum]